MFFNVLQAVAALAVSLGLFGLAVYAGRRWGPAGMFQPLRARSARRLAVVESLTLDPQRRLVLVRCDAEEKLLLLGEGRLIDRPAPSTSVVKP
jgi:flagellar protein FliO/FliZ